MIPGAYKYKNIHSTDFKLVSKSLNRPILPIMRINTIEIPGVHGSYDFGNNTYGNRQISMLITYVGKDYNELRLRAREIAAWLTSKRYEPLIFDDEPDKFYLARIYNQVDFENLWRLGRTTVTFDCQPFAYSVELHNVQDLITIAPQKLEVESLGTYETSPIITLENQGNNTITSFNLRLEYEVD